MIMDNEILELKEQMAALQEKLDRDIELRDEIILKALDSSIDRLRSLGNKSFWLSLFALVFVESILFFMHFSVLLMFATFLFLGVNLYLAYLGKVKYTRIDRSGSLVEAAGQAMEFKKFNRQTTACMMPFALIWVAWYVYDACTTVFHITETRDILTFAFYFLFCGALGGVIGYFAFYRPSMKQADSIAKQIEELNS